MDRDALRSKLNRMNCGNYELALKWKRNSLDFLYPSLDKLTFANNAYRGKSVNSCLSVGEVDKQVWSIELFLVYFCNTSDLLHLMQFIYRCVTRNCVS